MGVPQLINSLKVFSAAADLRAVSQLKHEAKAIHNLIQLETGMAPAARGRDMGPAMKVCHSICSLATAPEAFGT